LTHQATCWGQKQKHWQDEQDKRGRAQQHSAGASQARAQQTPHLPKSRSGHAHSSKFRGVTAVKSRKNGTFSGWQAQITCGGQNHYLGKYSTEEEVNTRRQPQPNMTNFALLTAGCTSV
jgi:hypothetical protein